MVSKLLWMRKGRAVDVVFINFSKDFVTVSHDIFTEKMKKYGLDKRKVRWTKN